MNIKLKLPIDVQWCPVCGAPCKPAEEDLVGGPFDVLTDGWVVAMSCVKGHEYELHVHLDMCTYLADKLDATVVRVRVE